MPPKNQASKRKENLTVVNKKSKSVKKQNEKTKTKEGTKRKRNELSTDSENNYNNNNNQQRSKKTKLGGMEKLLLLEALPFACREGGKKGDILIGTSNPNFGLAIQLLEDAPSIARRGHLIRLVNNIIEKINSENRDKFMIWKENEKMLAAHSDFPLDLYHELLQSMSSSPSSSSSSSSSHPPPPPEHLFLKVIIIILNSEAGKDQARDLQQIFLGGSSGGGIGSGSELLSEKQIHKVEEFCTQHLHYDLSLKSRLVHHCFVDVHFQILDAGTGERSSIFHQIMIEAQPPTSKYPLGVTFDDLSQRIQEETGYNKATFFLNYTNLRHANFVEYKYEDEVSKLYRLENPKVIATHYSSSFSSGSCELLKFSLSNPLQRFAFVLQQTSNQIPPTYRCFLDRLNEDGSSPLLLSVASSSIVHKYNFPFFPSLTFISIDMIDNHHGNDDDNNNDVDNYHPHDHKITHNNTSASTSGNGDGDGDDGGDDETEKKIKITPGILKSLLQKQIRRKKSIPAIATAERILHLPTTYNPQFHTSSSGLATLLQRLIVIIVEEVGACLELSPLCWLAQMAVTSSSFTLTRGHLMYIRELIYRASEYPQRSYFFGTRCRYSAHPPLDYSSLFQRFPHTSADELALAFGIDLRCQHPGMASDKDMLHKVVSATLKGDLRSVVWNPPPSNTSPTLCKSILLHGVAWKNSYLLELPEAVDFHAYPAIVDRIFEERIDVFQYYYAKAKAGEGRKKLTAVDHLRSDIWDFSSKLNYRDKDGGILTCDRRKFFDSVVKPLFHSLVQIYLTDVY